ncbi:hypothetical protein M758_UG032900 [Ceratodon purpureus]|nr:hypothetical protein M758_UG032900 [Ceratodon purpureus]
MDWGHQTGIMSKITHFVEVHGLKDLFVGVVPRIGRRALQQAFAWYEGKLYYLRLKSV